MLGRCLPATQPQTCLWMQMDYLSSADSQFYICLGVLPNLDHQYTVFGQVVEGMEVVKQISVGDKMETVAIQ
ncbi:MAG: peptidylprolyl isomerase [Bdellovibrio sp.]|nr:peptidylprolyl isomerase [Bdellovibrio sp.]